MMQDSKDTNMQIAMFTAGKLLLSFASWREVFRRAQTCRLQTSTVSLGTAPEGSVRGERANFTRLVIGYIEAKFCK